MPKTKITYFCKNCGYDSLKWLGRCPNCNEWNTFTEEKISVSKSGRKTEKHESVIAKLSDEPGAEEIRKKTGIEEFDRVLGGGLIKGSVVLIGGDPGIGKSTLVMQAFANSKADVLYITGEESIRQVNLRAKRLGLKSDNFSLMAETDLDTIADGIKNALPEIVIIDSIQTVYKSDFDNAPGTVTQIRECTSYLMQIAKTKGISIVIIGHVTKEGMIAGPKVLEHIVDTVLQFEGEKNYNYRILRALKNRFGSTNEIGIFEMLGSGLQEVKNPSALFLSQRGDGISGSSVTASIEGTRPVLLEVQALVTPNNYSNPQRVATGFDYRRLSILLAVLEKQAGLRLSAYNVFVNMAGGMRIDEPAVDLALCCAISSSYKNIPVRQDIVIVGEVGLGGEIRAIGNIEKRIQEAAKLGFEKILIPKNNLKNSADKNSIQIIPADNIISAISQVISEN